MAGEWMTRRGSATAGCYGTATAEDRQLELTLGLPGGECGWAPTREVSQNKDEVASRGLSLGPFPKCPKNITCSSAGGKRGIVDADEACPGDMKACAASSPTSTDGTVARARSQARTTTAPVVGWPPIRSFRKNIVTTPSSRLAHASKGAGNGAPGCDLHQQKPSLENHPNCSSNSKGVFVKINMDGIPIGRKVDLTACDGYDSLSTKVDKLFRGLLLAAQKVPPVQATAAAAASAPNSVDESSPVITGLLDGTGEYTLVYEDEEGDRILVGDVPWGMFITTARRLRVLKTSELSNLSLGATSRKRTAPGSSVC